MGNLNNIVLFTVGFLLLATSIPSRGDTPSNSYEVVFQWKELDYKWPSPQTRDKLLQNKEFIPENNILSGVKIFGDRMFIAVPRRRMGAPSTLNMVRMNIARNSPSSPPLTPYPSWEMQKIGDCNAFQYVQSMEIDEFGRMWVIDTGRLNLLDPEPVNQCPAKLVIVDLKRDEVVMRYEFPPEVVSPTSNQLNDLVVGCSEKEKCWVYISDSRDAKLVVYNLEENRSWFVHHKTMEADPTARIIPILGTNYTYNASINGIALSPKDSLHDRLYYSALTGYGIYSVRTSVLKKSTNGAKLRDLDVNVATFPSSQTDGMTKNSEGLLFYGLLQNNSIAFVNTSEPGGFHKENILASNDADLQWPDSFGFDDKGYLYVSSGRNQRYITNSLDLTDVNFRIARVFIGTRSYKYSAQDKINTEDPPQAELEAADLQQNSTDSDANAPDQFERDNHKATNIPNQDGWIMDIDKSGVSGVNNGLEDEEVDPHTKASNILQQDVPPFLPWFFDYLSKHGV